MPPNLDDLPWPRRTPRLTIRRGTPDDAEATWRYRQLESVGTWVTTFPRTFEAYCASYAEHDRLASLLVYEHDGVVVGDLMLRIEDPWSQAEVADQARGTQAELGWTLDPAYGGRGLATEAVEALLRISFEQLGLRRVVANCFADNISSWRLMERLGMRREAHNVRDSLHRSGEWLDGYTYALLAEEWAARGVTGSVAG